MSFGTIVPRRLVQPVLDQLRQGLTPAEIALTIRLGFVLSVPPVLGSTIVLCGLAVILLRLNQPVIQTVNFAVYPLQLALLVPYVRLGEWIFGASRTPLSPALILSMAKTNFLGTIATFWTATWHGVVAWAIVTPSGLALPRGRLPREPAHDERVRPVVSQGVRGASSDGFAHWNLRPSGSVPALPRPKVILTKLVLSLKLK